MYILKKCRIYTNINLLKVFWSFFVAHFFKKSEVTLRKFGNEPSSLSLKGRFPMYALLFVRLQVSLKNLHFDLAVCTSSGLWARVIVIEIGRDALKLSRDRFTESNLELALGLVCAALGEVDSSRTAVQVNGRQVIIPFVHSAWVATQRVTFQVRTCYDIVDKVVQGSTIINEDAFQPIVYDRQL